MTEEERAELLRAIALSHRVGRSTECGKTLERLTAQVSRYARLYHNARYEASGLKKEAASLRSENAFLTRILSEDE